MLSRQACVVAAVVACALGIAPTDAAVARYSAGHHSGVRQVSPAGLSQYYDWLRPVAGSDSVLVYTATGTGANQSTLPPVLMVRNRSGKTTNLGTVAPGTFSLAGTTLIDATSSRAAAIEWWNLKTGQHGHAAIPKHHRYLGSAPGGMLLADGGKLMSRSFAGKTTARGTLSAQPTTALVSSTGFVTQHTRTAGGELAYQTWKKPGQFTELDSGTSAQFDSNCGALTTVYVACAVNEQSPRLIRLNGQPPASNPPVTDGADAVLAGNTLVYAQAHRDTYGHDSYTLASDALGSSSPMTSTTPIDRPLVSAYGEAIASTRGGTRLIAATDAAHPSLAVGRHHTPATAAEFALAPGRVVWTDDLINPAHPGDLATVRTRRVTSTASRVTLDAPKRVARMQSDPPDVGDNLLGSIAAGQQATAWQPLAGPSHLVQVRSPYGAMTAKPELIAVSNRWLLTTNPEFNFRVKIHDLKTGRVRTLPINEQRVAMFANTLVYIDHQELVARNLPTGRVVRVARRDLSKPSMNIYRVFVAGNWVGWNDINGHGHLRNFKTMKPAITLSRQIASLGTHAAVLIKRTYAPSPVWVRAYRGGTRKVLKHTPAISPAIQGHTLMWIGADGQLEAMPVRLP